MEYREEGFLPEAIVNYLALLGWNPGTEQEDFALAELVDAFDLASVHKSGAVFDLVKFKNVNQRWMRKLSDEAFATVGKLPESVMAHPRRAQVIALLKERATTFGEARAMLEGELMGVFTMPSLDAAQLCCKADNQDAAFTKDALAAMRSVVEALPEGVSAEAAKEAVMPLADGNPKEKGGRGAFLWPLRYALSGRDKSPDPFTLVSILGPHESLTRIDAAISALS